ncbi:MAG: 3-phosphoshikimate 1-carboxyvinyltransferase [Oscillospiraceae bacterium]|nr:3-phosphoshikimate 1-carboxyvinyltransferase [Oscillospiraceae bacterium]
MTMSVPNIPINRTIAVPSSKSDIHRKLICAFVTKTTCDITYTGELGQDIRATIDCLRALGAVIDNVGETLSLRDFQSPADSPVLDCRESGSTLRFLLPVAAAVCEEFTITGAGRLPERPIDTALTILREHGCVVDGDKLPLCIKGKMVGENFSLAGDVSSQYLSGLLFALPLLGGGEITLTTPLESRAYVDMTMAALAQFGVQYVVEGSRYILSKISPSNIQRITADGDWSNGAFLLCAGVHPKAQAAVTGLSMSSLQGDKEIVNILEKMGANLEITRDTVTVSGGNLRAITLDVREIPDLVPPVAIVMSVARGQSRIVGGERLRLKESDRIAAMARTINSLGGTARETSDGLIIDGVSSLKSCTADSFNDHRVAMALAIAAPWCDGAVTITDAGAVEKSYPGFYEDIGIFEEQ